MMLIRMALVSLTILYLTMTGACTMFGSKTPRAAALAAITPTAQEYRQQARPSLSDYDLARAAEKRLAMPLATPEGYSAYYMQLQAFYKLAFEHFIAEKLDLAALETDLEQSPLGFIATDIEHQSIYERYSSLEMSHVFIHNNLYLERLKDSDLQLLSDLRDEYLADETALVEPLSAAALSLVERSWQDVVTVLYPDGNPAPQYDVLYPDGVAALSGSVIVAINNPTHYDASGNRVAGDGAAEREAWLQKMLPPLVQRYREVLATPVALFVVDRLGVYETYGDGLQ
jgi:hypothetical protein